jgi:hypothetical protein
MDIMDRTNQTTAPVTREQIAAHMDRLDWMISDRLGAVTDDPRTTVLDLETIRNICKTYRPLIDQADTAWRS